MKETRFFYAPDAIIDDSLPEEEAQHALRVLRLKSGDEMMLIDGAGNYFRAEVTLATNKKCMFRILETLPQESLWPGRFHLAIAPTKMMERMEWMTEKSTEMGIDSLSFLLCDNSERKVIKTSRLDKIVVSAMKQSHKAWKPAVNEMVSFHTYINQPHAGLKFIAHCYEEIPRVNLFDALCHATEKQGDVTVLIGPEGDFSLNEVQQAVDAGFVSVDLGASRLRTETAGLMAVAMMHLSRQVQNEK